MNDEKLMKAIQNHDEEAIEQLITKYSKLLWKIVGPVLQNVATVQDMEECIADAFISLWCAPEKYDATRGSLKSYLALVARSKAIDRYRELTRHIDLQLEETLLDKRPDMAQMMITQEAREDLMAALRSMGPLEREILLRRYYYEQKPREIARAVDLPVKQVENHLYRTKQKLRAILSE